MFLLDTLLLAPGKAVLFMFEELAKKAQEEFLDDDSVKQELQDIYAFLEAGTISEQEFEAREFRLLQRLEQIARAKFEGSWGTPSMGLQRAFLQGHPEEEQDVLPAEAVREAEVLPEILAEPPCVHVAADVQTHVGGPGPDHDTPSHRGTEDGGDIDARAAAPALPAKAEAPAPPADSTVLADVARGPQPSHLSALGPLLEMMTGRPLRQADAAAAPPAAAVLQPAVAVPPPTAACPPALTMAQVIESTLRHLSMLKLKVSAVTAVSRSDDGWRVTAELLERKAVPDTSDLLGVYDLQLDAAGNVLRYERTHMRRRSDLGR